MKDIESRLRALEKQREKSAFDIESMRNYFDAYMDGADMTDDEKESLFRRSLVEGVTAILNARAGEDWGE